MRVGTLVKSIRTWVILPVALGNFVLGSGSAFSKEVREVPLVPSQLFSRNERSRPDAVGDFGSDPYQESFAKRFTYSIAPPIPRGSFITSDGRTENIDLDRYTIVHPDEPKGLYFWCDFMSYVYRLLRWTKLIAG